MKMATGNVETIERFNTGEEQEFGIEFSAKMASILADGLYSNKIQSVIRELCCNAYDSHVAAGHPDLPIKVHFPNRLEPHFYVEDFGTGLSHNEVMNIYTRYGVSTKTNSNDFIGALGLGSKSPFALTSAFTVETCKDGIENSYSMIRNEKGMPTCVHLGSVETTKPNGVKVLVPVHTDQRNEFIEKSKAVFKWFPVKPVIVGDTVSYDTVEYQYEGNGWGIIKSERTYNYGYRNAPPPVALMGLVAYPLDVKSIPGLSDGARALLSTAVVLKFGIGDIEVAANREALGYDERTCAAIVNRMNTMIAELGAEFEKQIAEADTLWNAKKKFCSIFANEYRYQFNDAFKHLGLKWKGQVIKEYYQSIVPGKLYGLTVNKYADCKIQQCGSSYRRGRSLTFADSQTLSLPCNSNTIIIYNDMKHGGLSRISEYNKTTHQNNTVYVFHPHDKVSFKALKNALGNPEIILSSSLPKPARKAAAVTGVYKFKTFNDHTGGAKDWEAVTIDLEEGGYYVDLNGWDHVWNGTETASVEWWVTRACDLHIINSQTPIYAMRNKNKKFVAEHSEWTNLVDKVKEHIETVIRTRNISSEINQSREYNKLQNHASWYFWKTMHPKDANSPMTKFIATVGQYMCYGKDINTIQSVVSQFGIDVPTISNSVVDLVEEHDKLLKRYPMLKFVKRYNDPTSEQVKDANDYVDFIDTTAVFLGLQDKETC